MADVNPVAAFAAPETVHIAIMRVVRPGRERDFERLIDEFFQEAARQPGVSGAYLIRPFAGVQRREYGILRSFASPQDRDRFYASDLYRKWNEAVAPLVEGGPRRQDLHGMEAFFREAGAAAPSRWKMALLTWLAVNVAVYIFSTAVPASIDRLSAAVPALSHLPMLVTFMLVNALVVASLTWVLMPLLTRWFNNWLQPAGQ